MNFSYLITLLIEISVTLSYKIQIDRDDTKAISQAITQTIEKLQPNYERSLEILILGELSSHLKDIVDDVSKKLVELSKVVNIAHENHLSENIVATTLLLTKSIKHLNHVNDKLIIGKNLQSDRDLKLYIYCEELTLNRMKFVLKPNKLFDGFARPSEFEYFFVNDNENNLVHVTTFIWFFPNFCNTVKILTIGKFSKDLIEWKRKLIKYNKYGNFFGCEIVYGVPHDVHTHFNYSFEVKIKGRKLIELHGIYMNILDHAKKIFNMTIAYQFIKLHFLSERVELIKVNPREKVKRPNVGFVPMAIGYTSDKLTAATTPFYDTKKIFMVSPGLLYTPFEKLFLPFDYQTWIYLSIAFGVAFCVIFAINFSPQWMNDIVYGYLVNTPSLNVLASFFGISQPRLPNEAFARIILTTFVFFCLVMRTAYQGVQFDMMRSDMRRKPIEKISDIWEQQFDVYFVNGSEDDVKIIDGWRK